MRIMQIIRAANRDVMHAFIVPHAPQLLDMPVEALVFGEEFAVVKIAVEQPDRVMRIARRQQPVAGFFDCLKVSRRDIPRHTGHCEVFGHFNLNTIILSKSRVSRPARF